MREGYWGPREELKEVREGRPWGNKVPTKEVTFSKDGEKFKKTSCDTWEGAGSYDPDQKHYSGHGQYARLTFVQRWIA